MNMTVLFTTDLESIATGFVKTWANVKKDFLTVLSQCVSRSFEINIINISICIKSYPFRHACKMFNSISGSKNSVKQRNGYGLWARTNIKRETVLKFVEGFLLEKNVTILENDPKCSTYSEWKEKNKVYNLAGPIELINRDYSN